MNGIVFCPGHGTAGRSFGHMFDTQRSPSAPRLFQLVSVNVASLKTTVVLIIGHRIENFNPLRSSRLEVVLQVGTLNVQFACWPAPEETLARERIFLCPPLNIHEPRAFTPSSVPTFEVHRMLPIKTRFQGPARRFFPVWCLLVVFFPLQVTAASPAGISDDPPDSKARRCVLIQSVTLLRPNGGSLIASAPTDLIISDGRVQEIGENLGSKVSPSTMRLRRPGRWLMASPVGSLSGGDDASLFFDDLIHAGLMGFGELIVGATPKHIDIIRRRALLESAAIPIVTPRDSESVPPHAVVFSGPDEITLTGSSLPDGSDVLTKSALRRDDPFQPGAPAHFLLLSDDPRESIAAVTRPDAVLVGGEVVLKSERLVRLEEHARFDPDHFRSTESSPSKQGTDDSIYEVVIAGIPRELIRLRIERFDEGRMRLELEGETSSPITRSSSIALSWPDGTVTHRGVIRRHAFETSFKTAPEGGGRLEIIRDGTPLPESPLSLEKGDRYLPDTLLILLDALWNPTQGKTRRVVELNLYGGPVSAHWSAWQPLEPVSFETTPTPLGLTPSEILHLARVEDGQLMTFSGSQASSDSIWVVVDTQNRLAWALYQAPSGPVEWRRRAARP